jgi:hypothetical protein
MYDIETAVKPIFEKMGLYRGNDVSCKEVFEKYLSAFPQGIKLFWKFQVIVKYEINLFVKTIIFDGIDYVDILSCKPKEAVPSDNRKESPFDSMKGVHFYSINDDESFVDHWLYAYESYYDECEYPNNKLYRYERQHKKIARYWLQHGKHDPAAKSPIVLRGQRIWDEFIKAHICWKSKINWIGAWPNHKKVDPKYSFRRWL